MTGWRVGYLGGPEWLTKVKRVKKFKVKQLHV
ncbi:MAG: hypothetical protein ACFS24_00470 [Candidatus Karelsulcia muelleri]